MSCGCSEGNGSYNNLCNADTPYPIVSPESVPSLISNLTYALYGEIQKDVSNGKVVWIIPCDPNNTAFIGDVPRLPGEGLMCYFIRYFNTVYPLGTLAVAYGGTGASTAQAALSNLGGVPTTRQIITAPSSGLSGGGTLAADRSLSIANTTVAPGTYGSTKRIPVITVNSRGQLTQVTQADAEGFASVETEVITAADPSPNVRQTVFNLTTITYSPGTDNLAVYRNGIRLLLGQDYTETNNNTVTLTRGVAAGNQLLFESGRIISQDISAIAVSVERQTANAQQTVFNLLSITYVPGNNSLAVYRNGLKLSLGLDYIETNSATVTLTDAVAAGDQLTFEAGKLVSQQDPGTVVSQVITSSLGQTVFSLTTITYTPNVGNLAVYQDGLRLISGTDYTETNSTTVTLTTPALAGRQFMFEAGQTLSQPAPVAAASQLIAATAGQTVFALGLTYVPNTLSLAVFRNGLRLVSGSDYTETNSNTVTLAAPAALGDQFVFEAGKILTNALAGTSVSFQQAGTGAVSRNMQDKARESVSVLDFGADSAGATNSTTAFNAAAAIGTTVLVPKGTYLISSATTSAMWQIEDGAYISGLPDVNGVNDTSRLTGRVFHLENQGVVGIRVGSSNPWLEKAIRPYSESISEMSIISPKGQIALNCASRTSDDPAANFACIGVSSYGINNNTINPEPAWAAYLESRRSSGAGAAYCFEADSVNNGSTFDLDPFTLISTTTGQTVNCWITNGGGDISWSGNEVSAAIAIHPNPSTFKRGIVFRSGSLNSSVSEAITCPLGYEFAWYSSSGVKNSYIDHRRISQKTEINSSIGNEWYLVKSRASGAASQSLDSVFRADFVGCSGSGANYSAGFAQSLQRTNFSSGNARFSFDFQATGDGGVGHQITLNGIANASFCPIPDNTISLGLGGFRWSTVYATTGAINTSDVREKQQVRALSDKEQAVAKKLKSLVKAFKFNEAVEKKGDKARIHVGVIAQEVVDAFASEGLDATDYAILCYDEWSAVPEERNEDGVVVQQEIKAGNRYGVRYEELLAFIISAL